MNLPNKITTVRLLLIPIIIFFFLATFVPFGKIIALIILVIATCTDFVDGMIARKYNLVTDLGKLLDPIADKVLVMSALLLVVCDGTIPAPYGVICAIIILARELIVSAFRQIAASKNFVMSADKWGKIKTIVQCVALPVLFLLSYINDRQLSMGNINTVWYTIISISAYVLISLATILTVISGMNYLIRNRGVLKND